ncbi:UNVERIFIED_CONTAM: hypothetical protein PYX00_003978 [Menopon gallinae]|uniref:FIST C-domain domain-containing protein n=1 Tax=Menopon gallinae TaxID=328185 RepID=A0AAW2I2B3_9NEOP
MEQNAESSSSQGETSTEDNEISTCQPELLEYLSSAYEILRKVFSYLYLEDIVNAVEAFESWKSVAEITRKGRRCIESYVISDSKYKMSKIWSEARFCICFCTAPNRELGEKVAKFITPGGEFLHCLSGAGVIGTVHDLSQIIQQKVRVGLSMSPKKFHLTTLRFPNVPNVGIKTFVWEEHMGFQQFRNSYDIPSNQIIKCLIILMIAEGSGRIAVMQKDDFIQFLRNSQKQSFAIGGCVIDNFVNYSRANASNSVTKYIVFYGDNVEAASTVLTADVKSLAGIESKVKKLKEMCPVTNKGALFVFRCAGRQSNGRMGKLKNDISKWEGETIQKHFPNTPVVGCFGYGEFGTEHPVENDPFKKIKAYFDWDYSFSTSIVYIGFMK